jgi:hypothetical protein
MRSFFAKTAITRISWYFVAQILCLASNVIGKFYSPENVVNVLQNSTLELRGGRNDKPIGRSKHSRIPCSYTVSRGADGSAWIFFYEQKPGNVEYLKDKLFYNKVGQTISTKMGLTYLGSDSGIYQREDTFKLLISPFNTLTQAKILKQCDFDKQFHQIGRDSLFFKNGKIRYRSGYDVGNGQGLQYAPTEEKPNHGRKIAKRTLDKSGENKKTKKHDGAMGLAKKSGKRASAISLQKKSQNSHHSASTPASVAAPNGSVAAAPPASAEKPVIAPGDLKYLETKPVHIIHVLAVPDPVPVAAPAPIAPSVVATPVVQDPVASASAAPETVPAAAVPVEIAAVPVVPSAAGGPVPATI